MNWRFWTRRPVVVIRYRNGDVVRTRARRFAVRTAATRGGVSTPKSGMSVEWEGMTPRPLLIGTDDIQSIWEE